jgi:hypothetical protein
VEQFVVDFQKHYLQSFVITQQGLVQKIQFAKPMVETLQDITNEAIHCSLFHHS